MFCPRCGTDNNPELKYCRNCGQALSSVRLALEGHVDQAITTLRSEQKLSVHRVRIVASVFLILTALATLLTGGWIGLANVGSAAILLIITLIFFLQLALRARRVARLLSLEAEPKDLRLDQLTPSGSTLPESKTAALNVPVTETPMSVAERTTLKLISEVDQKS
jgi:hypothetical protein